MPPTLFTGGSGGGFPVGGDVAVSAAPQRVELAAVETSDEGLEAPAAPTDPNPEAALVRERARAVAARLSIPRPRVVRARSHPGGDLVTDRYRGDADDIDLDRTMDAIVGQALHDPAAIVVRARRVVRRSVVLLVDVSGSMRGERVLTAAVTTGALASELARDRLGVIAFWSDAMVIRPLEPEPTSGDILDALLAIEARGLTNVSFPLELAGHALSRAGGAETRALILSDCVHNAGPDPRLAASRLERLDVLLDTSGEHDEELARDLAAAGRGRMIPVRGHRDVLPALEGVFAR